MKLIRLGLVLAMGTCTALGVGPAPTDGLVAYYTFTGNAVDSSGRGHDPEHLVGRRLDGLESYQLGIGEGGLSPAQFSLNQWTLVTETLALGTQKYYINGSLVMDNTTGLYPATPATASIDLLIAGSAQYQRFLGSMDEVRLYNRILAPDEVQQIYLTEVPEPGVWAVFSCGTVTFLIKRARRKSKSNP
jgi:hypothetical protein